MVHVQVRLPVDRRLQKRKGGGAAMALVSNSTAMLKQNYHQTFEIHTEGNRKVVTRHTLLLNPQSLTQAEQAKVSVTQTLGGAYVTDFGEGLQQVTIAGTTGYKQRYNADGELRDGFEEFVHFRNEVYRKFVKTNDPDYMMFWYNWEDKEYYRIQPISFRLQRSVSESLLYRYEFVFTCLNEATKGYTSPEIANPNLDFISIGSSLSSMANNATVIVNALVSKL